MAETLMVGQTDIPHILHIQCLIIKLHHNCTGKSLSETLILTSTNPQRDKRLFIDLPVHYMKTTYVHAQNMLYVYINCFECQNKNKKVI